MFKSVKLLEHYVLSEHANNLYKKEASSTIALAKGIADKVNEIVDAYNELAKNKLEKIHEQDGKIRKAILYMKDNLLNTINDLLNVKGNEMMDNAVKRYLSELRNELDTLDTRLDNLLGSVKEGSTILDAEIIDSRLDVNGVIHASAGVNIRNNQKKNISYISDGDLNNLHSINQYSIVLGDVLNVPENKTGYVDIQTYSSASNVKWTIQKWFTQDGTSYIRVYRNSWSEWISLSKPGSNNITDNLDNYVDKSLYGYVNAYNPGAPVVHAGLVDIQVYKVPNTTTKMITQTYYAFGVNRIYIRSNIGGVWKEWLPMNPLFDKKDHTFIDVGMDLNSFTDNFYGIALGKALHTPENDTALIDVQRHGSTASTTFWVRQTWYSLNTGNVYYRVLIPNSTWTSWNRVNTGSSGSVLAGKKIVFMGDSIIGNKQDATGIVKQFEKLTDSICYNFAFGGTGAKKRASHTDTWATLDGESLADAITSGNFITQTNAISIASDFLGYFADTIENLKTFDFSTADYLIINYGTNDWTSNYTQDEYKSAIEYIVSKISTKYPNLIVIKMKPTIRFFEKFGVILDSNEYDYMRLDTLSLKEFVKVDNEICESLNLQLIDTYNIGINKHNYTTYFTSPDLTHPNNKGCKRIADVLATKIS